MSEWTVDTLREHLETVLSERDLRLQQRFDAQQAALDAAMIAAKEAVATAMTAAKEATAKAELAADKRFEAVNEFRQTLTDQQQTFIARPEAMAAIERNTERTQDVAKAVQTLTDRINTQDGRSEGLSSGWAVLATALLVIAAVAGVIGHFIH